MLFRIVSWQLQVFPWRALLPRRHFPPPGFFIFLKVRYFARPRHKTPKPPHFRVNYVYGVWGFVWCIPVCCSARLLKLTLPSFLLRVFVFIFVSLGGFFSVLFPPAPPLLFHVSCFVSSRFVFFIYFLFVFQWS